MSRSQSIIIGVGPHGTETIQELQSQSLSNAQFAIAGGDLSGVHSIQVAQQDMGSGSSIFQDVKRFVHWSMVPIWYLSLGTLKMHEAKKSQQL